MKVKQSWQRWLLTGVIVGAFVLAGFAVFPQITQAQTDSGSTDEPTTPTAPWFGRGMHGFGMPGFDMDEMHGQYQSFLAEALGIKVEDLQAAQENARNAMIDKAVEDGQLTQEQADLMKARQAFMRYFVENRAQTIEEALAAAVEAGAITQEQADLLLEAQQQMGRGMPGRGLFGYGYRGDDDQGNFNRRGMMPGFGGRMPGFGGQMPRFHDQMPGFGGRMTPPWLQTPEATPEANS